MGIENLSEDLLMEILCRLPVKSLLQFKSVCKNWYALIQNPDFIYLHHDRAASIAAAENTDCLLVKRFLNGGEGGVALSFVPNETPVEDIDISFTGLDIKHLQILGPCNGIVCLTRYGSSSPIVLCNPSMKEFRVLPLPSYKNDHMCNLGFGFDPYANDYKVVRFGMMSTDLSIRGVDEAIEMYDLSTDSWRGVDTVSPVVVARMRYKNSLANFYSKLKNYKENTESKLYWIQTDTRVIHGVLKTDSPPHRGARGFSRRLSPRI